MAQEFGYHRTDLATLISEEPEMLAGKGLLQCFGSDIKTMVSILTPIHGVAVGELGRVSILTEDGLDNLKPLTFPGTTPVLRHIEEVGDAHFSPDNFTESVYIIRDLPDGSITDMPHARAHADIK